MKNLLRTLTSLLLTLILTAGLMVPTQAEAATSKYITRLDFIKAVVNTINDTEEKSGVADKMVIPSDTITKYANKYSISEEDARLFATAVKMKVVTATQFKSLKLNITNQAAFIILAKADEYINGVRVDKAYAKEHIGDVYGLKKSTLTATKKVWVVKAYILGYMNCYGNKNVKLTAKGTKTALLSAVQLLDFDFDEYMAKKGVNKAIGLGFFNTDRELYTEHNVFSPRNGIAAVFHGACTAKLFTAEELNEKPAAKYEFADEEGYEWIYTGVGGEKIDWNTEGTFNFKFELVDGVTGKLVDTSTRTGKFALTYNGKIYENCEYVGWNVNHCAEGEDDYFAVKVPKGCRSLEIVTGDGEYQCTTFGDVLDWTQIYFPLDPDYDERAYLLY